MGQVARTGEAPGPLAGERRPWTQKATCRACGSGPLTRVLDLGDQPLANGFRTTGEFGTPEPKYPLTLMRCEGCELVQLSVVVDPKVMYGPHYPYRSGYSEGWALHCHDLAEEIGEGKRVLEIGCLDGVMLRHCRDNGCHVQGVDPSSPVVDLMIFREFWGRGANFGQFDYIIAQNVFGHVDDVHGFLDGVLRNLAPDGTCIIECPWIVDLIDGVRWDTVYHEHLSYWGVRPLMRLADSHRLSVNRVRYFPDIHGGTMRYYLSRALEVDPEVYQTWQDEEMVEGDWRRFATRFQDHIGYWTQWFAAHATARVGIYGASAKLNTFLNALPFRPNVTVFDDSPAKIGLLTPGRHYQVQAPTRDRLEQIDVLLVGAPNWKQGIEAKAQANGFRGDVKSLWMV